ncbi:MAG TPA: hypothetical protein VHM01_07520 [Alphaproteobacteria bacterium]|nr:hypothetical protein [Alphaproteobacteria bacterium]
MKFEIDREYDQRVLAALPPTLGLFAQAALRAQLREMAKQRRAICFTLMTPVLARTLPDAGEAAPAIATVLVCLHVAPALASAGLEAVLKIVSRAAETGGDPIHQLVSPDAAAGAVRSGFYREAIYIEANASIALTTHTPPKLPPEAMHAVDALVREAAIDAVTTVAIAPASLRTFASLPRCTAAASPTLH